VQVIRKRGHEADERFAILRVEAFEVDVDACEFVLVEIGSDAFNQARGLVFVTDDLADVAGLPGFVAVVREESDDGQICLFGDGDYGGVAFIVDVAFGVLQSQPLRHQMGETAQVQAQGDDTVGVPVDVKAPHKRGAVYDLRGRPGMEHRRGGSHVIRHVDAAGAALR